MLEKAIRPGKLLSPSRWSTQGLRNTSLTPPQTSPRSPPDRHATAHDAAPWVCHLACRTLRYVSSEGTSAAHVVFATQRPLPLNPTNARGHRTSHTSRTTAAPLEPPPKPPKPPKRQEHRQQKPEEGTTRGRPPPDGNKQDGKTEEEGRAGAERGTRRERATGGRKTEQRPEAGTEAGRRPRKKKGRSASSNRKRRKRVSLADATARERERPARARKARAAGSQGAEDVPRPRRAGRGAQSAGLPAWPTVAAEGRSRDGPPAVRQGAGRVPPASPVFRRRGPSIRRRCPWLRRRSSTSPPPPPRSPLPPAPRTPLAAVGTGRLKPP